MDCSTDDRTAKPCRRRVLLVDDNADLAELTAQVLTLAGFEVRVAWSADEAIGVLVEQKVDVLFSDINMPGASGLDLAREAKAQWPQVHIVLTSGRAFNELARAPPGTTFIAKPYRLQDLLALLDP